MAKVKCDLNLLENGHLILQNNIDNCTNLNKLQTASSCPNGCSNVNDCVSNLDNESIENQLNKFSKLNQEEDRNLSSSYFLNYNDSYQNINKYLFTSSTFQEVISCENYKDKKANLNFPRKFVNVVKKELNEDGKLKGTKKITKTCVLQPSLFSNIPPTIYFGLDDELSMCALAFCF